MNARRRSARHAASHGQDTKGPDAFSETVREGRVAVAPDRLELRAAARRDRGRVVGIGKPRRWREPAIRTRSVCRTEEGAPAALNWRVLCDSDVGCARGDTAAAAVNPKARVSRLVTSLQVEFAAARTDRVGGGAARR